jgi:hypothetical protein
MKNVLNFMGIVIGFFIWIEWIHLSFYLMTQPNTFYFFGGVLILALITVGPIIYYSDKIVMFLKNMWGVFFDKEKK